MLINKGLLEINLEYQIEKNQYQLENSKIKPKESIQETEYNHRSLNKGKLD